MVIFSTAAGLRIGRHLRLMERDVRAKSIHCQDVVNPRESHAGKNSPPDGMEWNGMVWYGMVWYGSVRYGISTVSHTRYLRNRGGSTLFER